MRSNNVGRETDTFFSWFSGLTRRQFKNPFYKFFRIIIKNLRGGR